MRGIRVEARGAIGPFDAVVARYGAMINGFDYLAITKLDVLDQLPKIKICVAYRCDGRTLTTIPAGIRDLARCEPIYEEMEGWQQSTRSATTWEALPPQARAYVDRLCDLSGVKLGMLSVGPERERTLRIAM